MSGRNEPRNEWRASSRDWREQHDTRGNQDGQWHQYPQNNGYNGANYNQWERGNRDDGRYDYRHNNGRQNDTSGRSYHQHNNGRAHEEHYASRNQPPRNDGSGRGVDLRQYTQNTQQEPGGWQTVSNTNNRRNHHYRNERPAQHPPTANNHHQRQYMLLLVGIPGSGKSTFAKTLESAAPHLYTRINQDTLGSRKKCEAATRRALQEGKIPIIDRCNFDALQRRYFVDIAREFGVDVHVVSLELPKQECIRRAEAREFHETIAPGDEVMVISKMLHQFQAPHASEGFASVQRISNVDRVNELMQEYVGPYEQQSERPN